MTTKPGDHYWQDERLVEGQFTEQISIFGSNISGAQSSHSLTYILSWLKDRRTGREKTDIVKIVEFGGATGILLKTLSDRLDTDLELYNAELLEFYRQHQALDSIRFVRTSILNADFEDAMFDVVVARNVLHHLIGSSFKQTRANQLHALSEMLRILRPGGILVLEEHTNQSPFACRMLYLLSRAGSRMGLRSRRLDISPHTVIAFLPARDIETMLRETVQAEVIHFVKHPLVMPFLWKLTLLRNRSHDLLAVATHRTSSS